MQMQQQSACCRRLLALAASSPSSSRLLSTTVCARSKWLDPKIFTAPIVTQEELNKPLEKDDPRATMFIAPMGVSQTPVFYRNTIVDKMVNVCMKGSNRELMNFHVRSALEIIKRKQYQKWLDETDEEKRAKIILDPYEVVRRGVYNCRPVMSLVKTVRAGTVYPVPVPLGEKQAIFRALKMLRDTCRRMAHKRRTDKRPHKPHFKDALASELLGAMVNEGQTIQAKQELHKVCEQNRSYTSLKRF